MKNIIIGIILVLAVATSAAQERPAPPTSVSCSQDAVTAATKQVEARRAALLALPIGDVMQTDVSPEAQHAITAMKESLGNFVNAYMRCSPPTPDPERIKRELSDAARAFKLPVGSMSEEEAPPDLGKYGFQLWFDVQAAQQNRLISIAATFDIECADDTVLFIFSPDGNSWKEVVRWQNKPYTSVKDAFWSFDSRISPPDESGNWYVATKHIAPWCNSIWSNIGYEILRPRAGDVNPKVLLSGSDSMWWGSEDYGTLNVTTKEFDVRFHSTSIDGGIHNRVWIRHFTISGDTVTRIQPVAVSPRDFVDEWLVSPWKTAIDWSSTSASEQLKQAHESISQRMKSPDRLLEFNSVYRCSEARSRYQIELDEDTGPKFDISHPFYFQVVGNASYTMTEVSDMPDPKCGGDNLHEDMSTE